jgi:hypothetical protein
MRTSIILDDDLGESLRKFSKERGQSLSAFLAEAGRAAMGAEAKTSAPPFELITFGEGGTHTNVNLDQTSDLLVAEDAAPFGQ